MNDRDFSKAQGGDVKVKTCQKGFTLIELMIVVTIVGLLASIAAQSYLSYTTRAANNACMAEARQYVTEAMIALNSPNAVIPEAPQGFACSEIHTAVDLATPIVAIPRSPGSGTISCDIPTTSCERVE